MKERRTRKKLIFVAFNVLTITWKWARKLTSGAGAASDPDEIDSGKQNSRPRAQEGRQVRHRISPLHLHVTRWISDLSALSVSLPSHFATKTSYNPRSRITRTSTNDSWTLSAFSSPSRRDPASVTFSFGRRNGRALRRTPVRQHSSYS